MANENEPEEYVVLELTVSVERKYNVGNYESAALFQSRKATVSPAANLNEVAYSMYDAIKIGIDEKAAEFGWLKPAPRPGESMKPSDFAPATNYKPESHDKPKESGDGEMPTRDDLIGQIKGFEDELKAKGMESRVRSCYKSVTDKWPDQVDLKTLDTPTLAKLRNFLRSAAHKQYNTAKDAESLANAGY